MRTERMRVERKVSLKHDKQEIFNYQACPNVQAGSPGPGKKSKVAGLDLKAGLQGPEAPPSSRRASAALKPVPEGIPPAVWASRKGDIKMLRALIARGDVNLEDNANGAFNPPIHIAVQRLNVKIVRLLLEHGVSLDSKDVALETVLESAETMNKLCNESEETSSILRLIKDELTRRAQR